MSDSINLPKEDQEKNEREQERDYFFKEIQNEFELLKKEKNASWKLSNKLKITLLLTLLITLCLILVIPKNTAPADNSFYVTIFGGLVTIGTFLPPFILAISNREEGRINKGKLVWKGVTGLLLVCLIVCWALNISIVFIKIIHGISSSKNFLYFSYVSITSSLFVLCLLLISILIAKLNSRIQVEEMGNVVNEQIIYHAQKNDASKAKELEKELVNLIFLDANSGRRQNVNKRLKSFAHLGFLSKDESAVLEETIFSDFGWLGQIYVKDRSLTIDIVRYLYFLGALDQNLHRKDSRIALARHELLQIFELTCQNNYSKYILTEIAELFESLTKNDVNERIKFIKRYSQIAKDYPEPAAWVQKIIVSWIIANPELLNDVKETFFDYIKNFDWRKLEDYTRSPNRGLKMCLSDFKSISKQYSRILYFEPKIGEVITETINNISNASKDVERKMH